MIRKNNKHGLSEIVISMIMIVLVLVAISIVWFIVRGILDKGTGQVNLGADCLEIDIEAASLVESTTTPGEYTLTLSRSAGGDAIGGVKVVLFNDTDNSEVLEFGSVLDVLETKTQILTPVPLFVAGNKVEITPYFLGESGNEQLCSTSTKEF